MDKSNDRGPEQARVASPHVTHSEPETVSVISLVNVLLRHRILLLILPTIALLGAFGYVLLHPVEYASDSTFIPQTTGQDRGRLSGLADQLGVNIGGGSGEGGNVEFYTELLTSRDLLREVVETTYEIDPELGEEAVRGTLVELLDVEGETRQARTRAAIGRLRQQIGIDPQPATGTVRLTTRASKPELAIQINQRMLELANDFNLRRRQSQASAEREFVETRLERAREELQEAEQAMETFLQQNRRYQDSPQLQFEFRRLERSVETKQQVFNSLATAFEQARITEVRNTPVITILDTPDGSARRLQADLAVTIVFAVLLGLMAAAVIAFAIDYLRHERRKNPEDYAEFQELRRSALARLHSVRPRSGPDDRRVGPGTKPMPSAHDADRAGRKS